MSAVTNFSGENVISVDAAVDDDVCVCSAFNKDANIT